MAIATLRITPVNPTIAPGTTLAFSATGTFSDGVTTVDLTNSVRWQTSNYAVAYMNRSGVAYGIASGTVTISATYFGLASATTSLTVSNATLQSISVTPASPTVTLWSPQAFAAIGTFSDGSQQDITNVSRWRSSDWSVAVVFWDGLAWSIGQGQTDITAAFDGVSNFAVLSVN